MKKFNFIMYALVVITTLNAQSDRVSGKIRGRVVDSPSKNPLAGANVLVLPVGSGRGTMTNEDGEFVLPNLMTGRYNVKVSYMGYASTTIQDIDVSPGGTTEILFSLKCFLFELIDLLN